MVRSIYFFHILSFSFVCLLPYMLLSEHWCLRFTFFCLCSNYKQWKCDFFFFFRIYNIKFQTPRYSVMCFQNDWKTGDRVILTFSSLPQFTLQGQREPENVRLWICVNVCVLLCSTQRDVLINWTIQWTVNNSRVPVGTALSVNSPFHSKHSLLWALNRLCPSSSFGFCVEGCPWAELWWRSWQNHVVRLPIKAVSTVTDGFP